MRKERERLEAALDGLLELEHVEGAALVSRDGIPVLSRLSRRLDQMAFSILVEGAMVATLVGSAEEALSEIEGGDVERTIVESRSTRLVVQGVGKDLLLLVLGTADLDPATLDDTAAALRNAPEASQGA